jgi:hypothetical protein
MHEILPLFSLVRELQLRLALHDGSPNASPRTAGALVAVLRDDDKALPSRQVHKPLRRTKDQRFYYAQRASAGPLADLSA